MQPFSSSTSFVDFGFEPLHNWYHGNDPPGLQSLYGQNYIYNNSTTQTLPNGNVGIQQSYPRLDPTPVGVNSNAVDASYGAMHSNSSDQNYVNQNSYLPHSHSHTHNTDNGASVSSTLLYSPLNAFDISANNTSTSNNSGSIGSSNSITVGISNGYHNTNVDTNTDGWYSRNVGNAPIGGQLPTNNDTNGNRTNQYLAANNSPPNDAINSILSEAPLSLSPSAPIDNRPMDNHPITAMTTTSTAAAATPSVNTTSNATVSVAANHSSAAVTARKDRRKSKKSSDSSLMCPICKQIMTQKGHLTAHIRTHSTDPKVRRPFVCVICSANGTERRTSRKHLLKKHVSNAHSDVIADVSKCDWIKKQMAPKIDIQQLSQKLLQSVSTQSQSKPVTIPTIERQKRPRISFPPLNTVTKNKTVVTITNPKKTNFYKNNTI